MAKDKTESDQPSELVVMGRLDRQLGRLPDDAARYRVVAWLAARHGVVGGRQPNAPAVCKAPGFESQGLYPGGA